MPNKIDFAWNKVFEQEDVLGHVHQHGFYDLPAEKLKKITGEEPRILTKWDNALQVPALFEKHKLSILPLSTTTYRISDFDVFHNLETSVSKSIMNFEIPPWITTLGHDFALRSENLLIAACYASGILREFLNEPDELFATVSGRLRTNPFSFHVDSLREKGMRNEVTARNPQIEIDAGYESPSAITLIEAKNRFCENFNIRQLYFPWRYFMELTRGGKKIQPVFIMAHNEVLNLFLYEFGNKMNFNSLRLVRSQRYSLSPTTITVLDIQNILEQTKCVKRKSYPSGETFPQADSFDLVIALCERAHAGTVDTLSVAEQYEYDRRQGAYYLQAARFLGLVEQVEGKYNLTREGQKIFLQPFQKRQFGLIRQIVKNHVFARAMRHTLQHACPPEKPLVAQWILEDGWELSKVTALRRASTVLSWTNWILNLRND